MNNGIPPPLPVSFEDRLIQRMGLKQTSAFSHGDVYIFDIIANSSNLIVSASNHQIKLYNPTTLAVKNILSFHTDTITQIKAPQEHFLMSSSKDGRVAFWDLRTEGGPTQVFHAPSNDPLLSFDVDRSGTMVAAGTELIDFMDAKIHFFDARNNSTLVATYSESHSDDITNVHFHPIEPKRLMTASVDGLVCQHNLEQLDEEEGLHLVANTGSSVNKVGYFGPSAEYFYCLSHMETLSLWTAETDLIHNFGDIRGVSNPNLGLTLDYAIDCQYEPSSGRLYLLSGSNEGQINILHVKADSLQVCQILNGGHSEIVRSTSWDSSRGILYSGGEDSKLGLWTAEATLNGASPLSAASSSRHSSPLQLKSEAKSSRSSPY